MSETLDQAAAEAAPKMTGGAVPYLAPPDGRAALEFYKKAFGAREVAVMPAEDGKRLMHACLEVNGAYVMMSDCFPEFGAPFVPPQGISIHLQVEDGEAWWKRAVDAGCEVTMPYGPQFWGDHFGEVKDPFGFKWSIGCTPKA